MTSKVRNWGAVIGTHIMKDLGSRLLFTWPRRGSQSFLHILWSCYIGEQLSKAWYARVTCVIDKWGRHLEEPRRVWGLCIVCGPNLCPPSFQIRSLEVKLNEGNKMNTCLISIALVFVSHSLLCQRVLLGGLFCILHMKDHHHHADSQILTFHAEYVSNPSSAWSGHLLLNTPSQSAPGQVLYLLSTTLPPSSL